MPWISIKNPPQKLLDKLWADRLANAHQTCHDCHVKPGEKHLEGCDTARCLICGGQYLSCGCGHEGYGDVWDGMWPGTKECYEQGLLAVMQRPDGVIEEDSLTFDYNKLAEKRRMKHE